MATYHVARPCGVARIIERLTDVYDAPVGIGQKPALGAYYAGIIRLASQGIKLHADFAPFNSPAYSIGRSDAQLAWNFFAEDLNQGGATIVHNTPWSPQVLRGEIPQSYDLPRAGDVGLKQRRDASIVTAARSRSICSDNPQRACGAGRARR